MSAFTDRDTKFMREACWLCDKSNCEIRSGSLIVKNNAIICTGWNELLLNDPFATSENAEKYETIHAESSMISNAARGGFAIEGGIAYMTRFPCMSCARMLVKAGVEKIFYMSDHFSSGNAAKPLLESNGIAVVQIPEEEVWKNYK